MMPAVKFQEAIFRKPDGSLVLVTTASSVGVNRAVDFSDVYRESARRYEEGHGWPKGTPKDLGEETIWKALRS